MPGPHRFKCAPHTNGVAPDAKPFFNPNCWRCQEKLAAGLVTGKEPMPRMGGRWLGERSAARKGLR